MGKADDKVLLVAIIFVFCAFISAMASAAVTSVEELQFSRVQLMGSNELEITQGDENSLKIRGDKGDLTPPPFVVQGDMLRLGVTPQGNSISGVKYKLTTKSLEALLLDGSGDIFVKPLTVGDLLVSVEGSGVIRMYDVETLELEMRVFGSGALQAVNVSAKSARLNLKGSGDIQLGTLQADMIRTHMAGSGDISVQDGGSTAYLEVGLMGSGDVAMKGLIASRAEVSIMGSGDTEIAVENSLEAKIMGSGDLIYHGKPKLSTSVMGSGDIIQRD
ncbi:MAG: DUF2807 domain-containing protein [Halioglobus sp.]